MEGIWSHVILGLNAKRLFGIRGLYDLLTVDCEVVLMGYISVRYISQTSPYLFCIKTPTSYTIIYIKRNIYINQQPLIWLNI